MAVLSTTTMPTTVTRPPRLRELRDSSTERESSALSQGVLLLSGNGEKAYDGSSLRAGLPNRIRELMLKNYTEDAFDYGNMIRALKESCRNVRWKTSVIGYELHALQNTCKLRNEIENGSYKISPYQIFHIHEPKEREIVATRIQDRQVQKALCNAGLYKDITEHFIRDNCACLVGRGTDDAINRLTAHMRRFYGKHGKDGWVLKCDIKKFFPSTDHDVAKAAIAKRVSDPEARQMVFQVIDSFGEKGIGLGSQISQLAELSVLDDLDHFIKERLRIKYYVRYMDDFILIHEDKEYLKMCWEKIANEVSKLGLELNAKTTMFPIRQGIRFLKWRFILTDTGKIVKKISGKKLSKQRRRLKKLIAKEVHGELAPGTALNSLNAHKSNAKRGDTYYQCKRMTNYYYQTKAGVLNDYARANPQG